MVSLLIDVVELFIVCYISYWINFSTNAASPKQWEGIQCGVELNQGYFTDMYEIGNYDFTNLKCGTMRGQLPSLTPPNLG